ncbi:MAG TPA: hypothetical protein IGR64_14175 [Leptolyngbyaceae cyanobacterium M65_K2018_010]|nr:hypothetical protein [Leptolyngbyaceae cyanobacterium M65_K2018_010]
MTSESATHLGGGPLAAIALKAAGLVAILSALLDLIIVLIPLNLTNTQWQLATTTQLVDRGIVPLVGIALLFTGFWVNSRLGQGTSPKGLTTDLRFWVCLLASVLGLMYLLMPILHLSAVRLSSQAALEQVSNEASQASTQLEQRLSSQLNQQKAQLGALFENESLLSQAIQSGQLPQDIQQFQNDPAGLDKYLQQQADQARQQLQSEIGSRRAEAERRVKTEAWKSGIRISITSLLLAVGYSLIGWQGLKRLLANPHSV